MRRLLLQFEDDAYPAWIGTGCLDETISRLRALDASSYHVVTDATVSRLHGQALFKRLSAAAPAHLYIVDDGETEKTICSVEKLAHDMVRACIDRGSVIVALGGGVIGNLAGLVAALLFRGVRLVHVPTTLVAAADSVASMKQAVNLPVGKNLLGCFHKPTSVLIDISYLQTLPAVQIRSGMCEIIKNALIVAPENLPVLERCLNPDGRYDDDELAGLVESGLLAKQKVMLSDKRERGRAIVFEYGHTVGHAIEIASGGAVAHGEAVGLGMIVAAEVAHELGHLQAAVRDLHHRLLHRNGLEFALPGGVALDRVLALLRTDNKRGYLPSRPNQVAMILLGALGQPIGDPERPLTLVDLALVESAIGRVLSGGARVRREAVGSAVCRP